MLVMQASADGAVQRNHCWGVENLLDEPIRRRIAALALLRGSDWEGEAPAEPQHCKHVARSPSRPLIRPSATFSPKGFARPVGEKEPRHSQSFNCSGTEFSRAIVSLNMFAAVASPSQDTWQTAQQKRNEVQRMSRPRFHDPCMAL